MAVSLEVEVLCTKVCMLAVDQVFEAFFGCGETGEHSYENNSHGYDDRDQTIEIKWLLGIQACCFVEHITCFCAQDSGGNQWFMGIWAQSSRKKGMETRGPST